MAGDLVKAVKNFANKIVKKTSAGSIILLHDGYGTEHNNQHADKSFTILALPLIIEQLWLKDTASLPSRYCLRPGLQRGRLMDWLTKLSTKHR